MLTCVRCASVLSLLGAVLTFPTVALAQGSCDVEFDPPPECFVVTVTPDGGAASRAFYSGVHSDTFTVRNDGQVADFYTLTCQGSSNVTCTGLSQTAVFLDPAQAVTITAFYSVTDPGSGTLTLTATGSTATGGGPTDDGTYTITVYVPPGAPIVDATPYNFSSQEYGRCAASCFAAVHAQGTVPYVSLDAPRNVTLAYNGDRVNPKPFIHVNVSPDVGYGQTPTEYQMRVLLSGTQMTFVNGDSVLRFAYTPTWPVRLGGQVDASAYGTGVLELEIRVRALYAGGPIENVIKTKLTVVNETTAPVARGWTVAGVQRLYIQADGSALITSGDGSAIYFQKTGGAFTAPAGEFSQVVANLPSAGMWTRRWPDSTKVVFNSSGRMTEVRDRFNNVTTVTYDGSNRVWQVKDPLNLAITLAYDANGLDAITDPMGRVTQVTVDASKRLTAIVDPDGVATTFGYDGSLRLATVTDRGGHVTTLGYDGQSGKVATVTAPSITYVGANGADSTGSPVTTLAPWHKGGVPYASTAGTPFTPPTADTVYGRVTDPAGHTTRFTVNRWGSPVQTTDPGAYVATVTYQGNGLPVRAVASTGATDTVAYNANGLPTYRQANQDPPVTITYAAWGQPQSIQQTGQPVVFHWIGANGRVDSTSVGGRHTRYRYDVRGRPDSVEDAEHHLVQRTWYAGTNGNRSKDSLPGARVTTYGYDSYGRPTTVTAPGYPAVTTFYSILNQPDSVRDGVNPVATRYGYDSLYLRTVTDPKGQVYAFTYNALGWVTARTDPVGRAELYGYNQEGLLRRWTNRRGEAITTTYDVLHRPLAKSGQNTDPVSWSYATDGRSVTASDPLSVVTEAYRVDGRLDTVRTQLAGQTYKVRYTYTAAGLVDSVIPSGAGLIWQARRYAYNATTFSLDSIHLGGLLTQASRNNDGQVTGVTLPGGDLMSTRFTSVHSEADITTTAPYDQTVNRFLGFDLAGRVWRHILGDGVTGKEYAYDSLGRLKEDWWIHYDGPVNQCDGMDLGPDGNLCTEPPSGWFQDSVLAFAYDSAGNRRDKGGQYTTGNRITSFDACTYETDFDGNVIERACGADTVTFAWSAENLLTGVTVNGQVIQFDYDARGRLLRKRVGGAVQRHFLWNGAELLAELDAAGTGKVAEYSYYPGLDNPHAVVVGSTTYFAHRDGVGNVIALTDTAKQVRRTYEYDAWGTSTGGTDYAGLAGADRARFKGALWMGDETELYYMRARWYEPRTGRFLSEDPIGLDGGMNPYAYVFDDPVNGSDPSGLCPTTDYEWVDGEWRVTGHGFAREGAVMMLDNGTMGKCVDGNWVPLDSGQHHGVRGGRPRPGQETPPPFDVGEHAEEQCRYASFAFTTTSLLDLSLLYSGYKALKLAFAGRGALREAFTLGARGAWNYGGRGQYRFALGSFRASDRITVTALTEDAKTSWLTVYNGSITGSLSWKDFVPVVASKRAYETMAKACLFNGAP